MPDKKSEFIVNDRRKFTMDGDVRPDAPVAEETTAETPVAQAPVETVEPPAPESNQAKPTEPVPPSPKMTETGYDADKQMSAFGGQKIEFMHLLDMIVQTAMMYAGAMDNGPNRQVDVVGMRQMIDMLGVLEEKTKGNLTEQEQTTLHNILFQMRMTYMEIINAIQKQATQGAPGSSQN